MTDQPFVILKEERFATSEESFCFYTPTLAILTGYSTQGSPDPTNPCRLADQSATITRPIRTDYRPIQTDESTRGSPDKANQRQSSSRVADSLTEETLWSNARTLAILLRQLPDQDDREGPRMTEYNNRMTVNICQKPLCNLYIIRSSKVIPNRQV